MTRNLFFFLHKKNLPVGRFSNSLTQNFQPYEKGKNGEKLLLTLTRLFMGRAPVHIRSLSEC